VIWWQLSVKFGGKFARDQYDRIRFGMTPAEVAAVMGGPPLADKMELPPWKHPDWEGVANSWDPNRVYTLGPNGGPYGVAWLDGHASIWVDYSDGKVIHKQMNIYHPWKIKAREWLVWLRGLVGW
jgi:hypothetical protein